MDDESDLSRFLPAQDRDYAQALAEIRRGQKRTHWMWYIFPQLDGLGVSSTAQFYALKNVGEARAYLAHPILGARLRECVENLLELEERSAEEIFGYPDVLKLRSSLTLFAHVSGEGSAFHRALDKFYQGEPDARTLRLLETPTQQ